MNRGTDQSHPWILSGNTIENCIFNDVRNENYGTRVPLFETMFSAFARNVYWNSFTTNWAQTQCPSTRNSLKTST